MARTAYVLALSQDYEDAYAKLLDLLRGRAKMSVTVFWPMRGERYDGDLMVIGQAPRKWFVSLGGAEMSNPSARRAKLADARAVSEVTVDTRSQRWTIPIARRSATPAQPGRLRKGKAVILEVVEGKGFEPSASGVRFQRSPGLS